MQRKDLQLSKDLKMNIYDYDSPFVLLKEYIERCQKWHRGYSYRHFSSRLGDKSPGYIQKLLNGSRPLTNKVIERLVELMGLDAHEQKFLELLVAKERVAADSLLHEEYSNLVRLRQEQAQQTKLVDEARINCDFSWIHLIVRETALLKNSRLDLAWIQRCLSRYPNRFSKKDILLCLEDLQQAGLLIERDGELKIADGTITFDAERVSEVLPDLLKKLHTSAIQQALPVINSKSQQREYGSFLIATTPSQFNKFRKRLNEFSKEVFEILEAEPEEATMVTSFSFQLCPVAQAPEG